MRTLRIFARYVPISLALAVGLLAGMIGFDAATGQLPNAIAQGIFNCGTKGTSHGYLTPSNHSQCTSSGSRTFGNAAVIQAGFFEPNAAGNGIHQENGVNQHAYCIDPGGNLARFNASNVRETNVTSLINDSGNSATTNIPRLAYVLSKYGQPGDPTVSRNGTPLIGVNGSISVAVAVYRLALVNPSHSSSVRSYTSDAGATALVNESANFAGPYRLELDAFESAEAHSLDADFTVRILSANGNPMANIPVDYWYQNGESTTIDMNQIIDDEGIIPEDPNLPFLDHFPATNSCGIGTYFDPSCSGVASNNFPQIGSTVTNAQGFVDINGESLWGTINSTQSGYGVLIGAISLFSDPVTGELVVVYNYYDDVAVSFRAYGLPAETISLFSDWGGSTNPGSSRQRLASEGQSRSLVDGFTAEVVQDEVEILLEKRDAQTGELIDGSEFELAKFSDAHRIHLIGSVVENRLQTGPFDFRITQRLDTLNNSFNGGATEADWRDFGDWYWNTANNPDPSRSDAQVIEDTAEAMWGTTLTASQQAGHQAVIDSYGGDVGRYIAEISRPTRAATRDRSDPYRDVLRPVTQSGPNVAVTNGAIRIQTACSVFTGCEELSSGNYSIRETTTPLGYITPTYNNLAAGSNFFVETDTVHEIEIENEPSGGLQVEVLDADTGLPLEDVPVSITNTTAAYVHPGDEDGVTGNDGLYIIHEAEGFTGSSATGLSDLRFGTYQASIRLGDLPASLSGYTSLVPSRTQYVEPAEARPTITLYMVRPPLLTTAAFPPVVQEQTPIFDLVTINNITRNTPFSYEARLWTSETEEGLLNAATRSQVPNVGSGGSDVIFGEETTGHTNPQEEFGNTGIFFDVDFGGDNYTGPGETGTDTFLTHTFAITPANAVELVPGNFYSWEVSISVEHEEPSVTTNGQVSSQTQTFTRTATHDIGIASETFHVVEPVVISTEAEIPIWDIDPATGARQSSPDDPVDSITLSNVEPGIPVRIVSYLVGPFENEAQLEGAAGLTSDKVVSTSEQLFTPTAADVDANGDVTVTAQTGFNSLEVINGQWFTWVTEVEVDDAQNGFNGLPSGCNSVMPLGNLGNGVPGPDSGFINPRYMMWSEETIFNRFADANPLANSAEHLVPVVYSIANQEWQYDRNGILVPFTPTAGDCLLARMDTRDADPVILQGANTTIHGIPAGFSGGSLSIFPNRIISATNVNVGEWFVTGSTLTSSSGLSIVDAIQLNPPSHSGCAATMPTISTGFGVTADDSANGTAYMMWSDENVRLRFPGTLGGFSADHFVVVGYDETNGWFAHGNDNISTPFEPSQGDCLIAELDVTNDTVVEMFENETGIINGIHYGYVGNVGLTPDFYNGVANDGEWGITAGPSLQGHETACPALMPLGQVNRGVLGLDGEAPDAVRYIMWTEEDIKDRFTIAANENRQSDHLALVYYDLQDGWTFSLNGTSFETFEPTDTDCIVAQTTGTDTAVALEGQNFSVYGIPAGYPIGDLTVTPNMWNGSPNPGEWGITGTGIGSVGFSSERFTVHNFNLDDPAERFPTVHNPVLVTGYKVGLDDPDQPLAGAAYELIQIVPDGTNVVIGSATSGADGFIQFEVEPGFQYCFQETIAPSGYQVDTTPRCTPETGLIDDIGPGFPILLGDIPVIDPPCEFGDPTCGEPPTCLNGLPCTGATDNPLLGWLAATAAVAGAALVGGGRMTTRRTEDDEPAELTTV